MTHEKGYKGKEKGMSKHYSIGWHNFGSIYDL